MKSKDTYKYICFELFFLNDVKSRLSEILNYGIVKYAHRLDVDINDITYNVSKYYNKVKNKPFNLYYENFIYDSHSDQAELDNHLLAQTENKSIGQYNYAKFLSDCTSLTKLHLALNDLELSSKNYNTLLDDYDKLDIERSYFECDFGPQPLVMIPVKMLLDYIKNDKTFRDFELLRAFLAIKSLQGNKVMVGTHKSDIIQRMIGAKNQEVQKHFMNDKKSKAQSKKMLAKYSGRYFFDQLILELLEKNFIRSKITPTGSRRMYLSTHLTMTELANEIINLKAKKSSKFKEEEMFLKAKINNSLKTTY